MNDMKTEIVHVREVLEQRGIQLGVQDTKLNQMMIVLTEIAKDMKDMPDRYIPRKEHEAKNLEGRLKELEERQQSSGQRNFTYACMLVGASGGVVGVLSWLHIIPR